MCKTHPLGFRVEPETKAALLVAAQDDLRSMSSLIEIIVTAWLTERGYYGKVLKKPARRRKSAPTKSAPVA